ncbi:MAG: hypothetical protein ACU0A2_04945 [Cognatishimia sp.]|uniref:hypothetical protein n=1 Tax=Cognatishimia sp. TaxID=2211648 RepID=UPI00405831BF
MQFNSFETLAASNPALIAKGPLALVFAEDKAELDSTLRHHLDLGFAQVLAFMPSDFTLAYDVAEKVLRVDMERPSGQPMIDMVNRVSDACPDQWLYYCFNAEYLMYPFCETRSVGEMLRFHTEERRSAMLTYVIDLYAGDLAKNSNAVSIEGAMIDKAGYYALARPDENNHPRERQLNFYGGLRWRFEEHIPEAKRKIDRISIFRAKPGAKLRPNFTFTDEEMNTYSCEWHNNLTAAVCSFRAAKALTTNPGSTYAIKSFHWHNSIPFEWHSRQLLDLGLMEPGQWF